MSFDIIIYQAEPVSAEHIAKAWQDIGSATAYDDYVVVDAPQGRLFAHLNNVMDHPDCLSDIDDEELSRIRAIVEPIYNIDIQSTEPNLLNEGFLMFPTSGAVAVDNDNGFIGRREDALELARDGADWLRNNK